MRISMPVVGATLSNAGKIEFARGNTVAILKPRVLSWTAKAECDVLPIAENPAWTLDQPSATNQTVALVNGCLQIKDAGTGTNQRTSYYRGVTAGVMNTGITIHLKVKPISNTDGFGCCFTLRDGNKQMNLSFYPDRVVSSYDAATYTYPLDGGASPAFREFWISITGNVMDVYYKTATEWVAAISNLSITSASAVNAILFGSNTTPGTGEAYWDFVRYIESYNQFPIATDGPQATLLEADSGDAATVWDISTLANRENLGGGTGTIKYDYSYHASTGSPSWSGTWRTLAEMQRLGDPTGRYFQLKTQHGSSGLTLASIQDLNVEAVLPAGGGGTKSRFAQALGVKEGFR